MITHLKEDHHSIEKKTIDMKINIELRHPKTPEL